MALNVLRGLFVLLMAAVGYSFVTLDPQEYASIRCRHGWRWALACRWAC